MTIGLENIVRWDMNCIELNNRGHFVFGYVRTSRSRNLIFLLENDDSRVSLSLNIQARELHHVENKSRKLTAEEHSNDHQEDQGETCLNSFPDNITLYCFLFYRLTYVQNLKGTSRRWRSSYDIFVVVQLQKEWVAAKDNLDRQNWLSTWTGKWLSFFNNWSFSWFWDCVWHSSFQFKI